LDTQNYSLTKDEINSTVFEEVLPFFEVIEVKSRIEGVCRDPDGDKFISCALSAGAKFIVSGDADLYTLKSYKSVRIIKPSYLLNIFYKKQAKEITKN
jgi:Predicted nucleic acid-binding protein, contains PIN domain